MDKIKNFLKDEAVLVISFALALVSAFFVVPDADYIGYIDFRTLGLLFCLMAVMAGFNAQGVFNKLAVALLKKVHSVRALGVTLTMLCFFLSMVITNDVALITFVPFTILVLKLCNKTDKMIFLVTMETVAANLGSMLTPIGNPQNLYLFSAYDMAIGEFVLTILPYGVLSLVLILLSCLFMGSERLDTLQMIEQAQTPKITNCIIYAVLFVLSLLTVLRVVSFVITLCVTVVVVLIFDAKNFKRVDYSLLFTFVFLFVFIGNLGRIGAVSEFLQNIINGREVVVGILASQVFSNVPAALLLSGFTDNAHGLLIGVNLGGLGTLIAYMASLISFKFVAKESISTPKYIGVFTVINVVFLVLNFVMFILAGDIL